MSKKIKTLDVLAKGQIARIKKLNTKGKLLQKLLDMGFVNNEQIEVIREAPLYDPMELKILDYHITVRKSEAALIEIEVENEKH